MQISGHPAIRTEHAVTREMSVVHLQAVAYLYGLQTAAPEKARILELGCQSGANLLPQALRYPDSQFVGIELACEDYAAAQQHMLSGGADNLTLSLLSLDQVMALEAGEFDYIMIHGSFTLLGNAMTDALLGYCRQHLSPQGVIAIGWACNPGAKLREALRDAVQIHSSLASDEQTQLASARAMMTFMSLGSVAEQGWQSRLSEASAQSETLSDTLFSHHYLKGQNEAEYLLEFSGRVENAGLTYVGDCAPQHELPAHFGEQVASTHAAICPTPHKILSQQYLDFAVNRAERMSLLTHIEQAEHIAALPDLARLADFSWAGSFRRIVFDGHIDNAFAGHDGVRIATDDGLTLSILDALGEAWPASLSIEQLVFQVQQPDEQLEGERENVLASLQALFEKGLLSLHYRLGKCEYQKSAAVRVGTVCEATSQVVTNAWHEPLMLSEEEQQALYGGLPSISEESFALHDSLRHKGLLEAAPFAWRYYLQDLLKAAPAEQACQLILSIMVYACDAKSGGFATAKQIALAKVNPQVDAPDMTPLRQKVIDSVEAQIAVGENTRARAYLHALVEEKPLKMHAWYLLANINTRTGDFTGALEAMKNTLALQASSWRLYYELAAIYFRNDMSWQAGRVIRAVLRCDKTNGPAWDLLGSLHRDFLQFNAAEVCARRACQLEPKNAGIAGNMGIVLGDQSKMEEALPYLRRAVKYAPDNFGFMTNLLFGLTHNASLSAEELFAEHLNYGTRVQRWADKQNFKGWRPEDKDPQRKLRVGFVSGDFGEHPVTNFLAPVWYSLDRNRYALFGYNSSTLNDSVTKQLASQASGWREVVKYSELELAELIKADRIDILIDLSGHTAFNRLPAFALRPSPVQMTWIGYPGTSGLSSIDYRIISPGIAPPGKLDGQFTEKLIYVPLPKQFEPEKTSPAVEALPALRNGYLTFGSFNRPKKLNDRVLALWAKILCRLPTSRMIVGYMSGEEMQEKIRSVLLRHGVNNDQIIFREKCSLVEYLAMHNEVDILLDAFPYTGGTTTNHGAWMGVPTITLAGETMAARQGVDILHGYGLDEFVAESEEEYVSKAVGWSDDLARLNTLRMGLRDVMAIGDGQQKSIATLFEKTLRESWQRWCAGVPVQSFTLND